MAHFAELDENNVVIRVIVVNNEDTHDKNGIESEELGIAFCKKIFGIDTKWRQTSYNGNLRTRYAGIGFVYHEDIDAFLPPKPFDSWIRNETSKSWEAPVPLPVLSADYAGKNVQHEWDEQNLQWTLVEYGDGTATP